jgi:predicted glycosyltransferase
MVLAARSLRIPVVTMYDYEYTETRIFNRFSDMVLVPEAIPDSVLNTIGLTPDKRAKYPGMKEELYVSHFEPAHGFRKQLEQEFSIRGGGTLAVVRPPATTANYHAGDSEAVLADVLRHLGSNPAVSTVIVPRTDEQRSQLTAIIDALDLDRSRFFLLDRPLDGLQLAYAADLLISGGGTMNREAALLGTPVYSIFSGRQGALDARMEAKGVITFIRSASDVHRIDLERKAPRPFTPPSDAVERFVVDRIDSFL